MTREISIRGVSYRYRHARPQQPVALNNLNLTINNQGIFGLLGPNGAGKTTLISLLCGLLPLTQGEILFDGRPRQRACRENRRLLALTPQDYAFYPMLSVKENLKCFAGVLGYAPRQAKRRIEACLAVAQLADEAGTLASKLSGGKQRRLNLAISLLGEPEILLLDEPTVGVDPRSRITLLNSLHELSDAGLLVILASHNLHEVEQHSSHIGILSGGQLRFAGPLSAALLVEDAARSCLIVRLRRALPDAMVSFWQLRLTAAPGDGAIEYALPQAAPQTLPRLLDEINATDGELLFCAWNEARQTLEQRYLALTHGAEETDET